MIAVGWAPMNPTRDLKGLPKKFKGKPLNPKMIPMNVK